jgi:hypothetical protein
MVGSVKQAMRPVEYLSHAQLTHQDIASLEFMAQKMPENRVYYVPIVGRSGSAWIAILPADGNSIIGYVPIQ